MLELNLDGYDVYDWVEGENGIYLSIGFGSHIMDGADTLLCYYEFLYSPDDEQFSCIELLLGDHSIEKYIWEDETEIFDVKTIDIQYDDDFYATYKVSMKRLLNPELDGLKSIPLD